VQSVSAALQEDLGQGDIHATLFPATQISTAGIICREHAILCGCQWVEETFRQLSPDIQLQWFVKDGDTVQPNQTLVNINGPTALLLSGERTALNFLQTLMGTATLSAQYHARLSQTNTRLLDTRKTIPGLRLAQKYAVAIAGGVNHRIGLWDAFLIKENHIAAAGGIRKAVALARHSSPDTFLEIEVETLVELDEVLPLNVDRVLLDNFSIDELHQAVQRRAAVSSTCDFEASGNVTLDTIKDIANTGVDYVSIGALTKHVNAVDLSFRIV